MPKRIGRYTVELESPVGILASAATVGKKEGEGPLKDDFDEICEDMKLGQKTWEQAESELQKRTIEKAIEKAKIKKGDIDLIFAGDLLSQCSSSSFALRDMKIPTAGLYGACSTMALSLALAALSADSGFCNISLASTSSHFCSAEKQFRTPLEYGGQRPPSSQWTATAAGCAVIGRKEKAEVKIKKVIFGRICDLGIKDANNMGAAMAPAACQTILDFLRDTKTSPKDYDMILTGDLGKIGSELLVELLKKNSNIDISAVHSDCGNMLFDFNTQNVNSGASGCGCSACVVCSNIIRRISQGELRNVLFVGTGALLSSISPLQGESIPGIAHGVLLEGE